jgi:hypothetical protein
MNGTLVQHALDAPALEGNPLGDPARRSLLTYLPPGYDGGDERYPVFYYLHGFNSSARAWVNFSGFSPSVPERLDALISQGAIPPVLAVFVDGWTALGGSQWDNSEALGRYRDHVVQDVVPFVDRTFRTVTSREGRALAGKSSGAYGALVLGRHHPDVFANLACHSGDSYFEYCYLGDFPKAASSLLKAGGVAPWFADFTQRARATKMRGDDFPTLNTVAMAAAYSPEAGQPLGLALPFELETGRLREDVWARWLALDPVRFIPQDPAPFRSLANVFVDCGTRDEANLRWGTRMVVRALEQAGAPVLHEEFEDGHMGINYRLDRSLLHLAPRLSRG